jgi:hypothetical protein
MAALTVKSSAGRGTGAGIDLAAALDTPNAGGDTIPAGGDVYLRLKTGGTAVTVSAMAAGANAGLAGTFLAPLAIGGGALAATGDKVFGPFPSNPFADPSDGLVHISYTAITALTVAVYRATNG